MDARVRALLEPKKYGKKGGKQSESSSARSPTTSDSDASQSITMSRTDHSRPAYDPRSLLNPRGPRVQFTQSKDSSQLATPDNQPTMPDRSRDRGSDRRSLMESVYSVEGRAERPVKRIKTNPAEDAQKSTSKSSSSRRGGPSIIGNYMKPDSDATLSTAFSNSIVDLTKDNDHDSDDDVVITDSRNLMDDQEVCFGMIHTLVYAHAIPKPNKESGIFSANMWPVIKCALSRAKSSNMIVEVKDPFAFVFGKIATDVATVLAPVMDVLQNIRTQARLINRPKKANDWPHQPCSDQFKMVLNLYGRRADAQKIGKIFGQHNIWLRNPMAADAGVPTVNPHAERGGVVPQLRASVGKQHAYSGDTRTVEEATRAVEKLFDYSASATAPFKETEAAPSIITTLLPHQKQALTFMLEHERPRQFGPDEEDNTSLWRKKHNNSGAVIYEEIVSGLIVKEEPDQVYGGLLADVMGLGKTIEALSLIAHTLDEAEAFGKQPLVRADTSEQDIRAQSKATLIIAPVSTVKNWEDQLVEHIQPGVLRHYVYHGSNRIKNAHELSKYDVVISTYSTIASEFSKPKHNSTGDVSPILQIRWFRVMLDEAHTIRESKATQSQAMYSIHAQRRWCLTGTPIQNRIDDLGSLTRFLRLFPYDTTVRFNQYVRARAQSGDQNYLKALRVFVDSFTLRRLKDRIDLPARQDLVERLKFSAEERKMHEFFRERAKVQIEDLAKDKTTRSGVQHHVLRGIMTLRLICAHGRELLKEPDLELLRGQSVDDAIDVDGKPHSISTRAAYESLSLMAEAGLDMCRQCDKHIGGDSPQTEALDVGETRAYVLPCFDLVCGDCFEDCKPAFDSMDDTESLECPFCTLKIGAQYVPISKSSAEVLDTAPEDPVPDAQDGYKQGQYGGPHTKTKALLRDIDAMRQDSEHFVTQGESPLKCVIFSEFTSHLDLIQRALDDKGYTYVRIDGSMSLNKRRKVLDDLNNDPNVTILLASIKAAGQGLNLTAASRAFIMEPLWNPAAEAQAVDRIYRIGQKREVIVKRYQMDNSIELKIVELQVKKQKLADISMNRNHKALSKQETREQHMKEIIALFK